MTNRIFQAACLIACSAITQSAQLAAQTLAASEHSPALVAGCECGGLISSTGNLYFTSFGINEFGPGSASFSRTGKYSLPGSEGLLYGESGPNYFSFGSVVWANVAGNYYGYFTASYERSGVRISEIKRVPLSGGSAVILAQSPAYIGVGDLATDGSTLFWVDEGGVRRMPINGGAVQTLVSGTSVSHIGLDSVYVYYSQGTVIGRVPKTGGVAAAVLLAAANVTALYVDVEPYVLASPSLTGPIPGLTFIYWGEQGGAVRSNNVSGSALFTWQNPIPGRDVTSVGFDGTRILWIDCTEPGNSQCSVRVQSEGNTTTVNAGVGGRNLQWDSTSMYWLGVPGVQRYVY